MFECTLVAGWADMDFNSHMRNSAFLDKCSDTRMLYFAGQGFAAEEFYRLRIGPVVKTDELEYFREVRLMEPIRVTLARAGLADDGSRFRLRNEIFREDGKLAARIISTGGWMDLDARKLIAPSAALQAAMRALASTDDFAVLPSSIK